MNIYMAPLEGITTYIYRNAVHRHFTAPDKFFTPYLSPASGSHLLTAQEIDEILPEHNVGIHTVPQLMVNRSDLCLEAIRLLKDLGSSEVNLNLGCPSGNVTRKRKGAGMLSDPVALESFLNEIFEGAVLPVSIKTRIGMHDPGEYTALLNVFSHFPIHELILHPRVRDQFYSGPIHQECWAMASDQLSCPLILNGDIRDRNQAEKLFTEYPTAAGVMIGRSLIASPDLLERNPGNPGTLCAFYREIEEGYARILPTEHAVLVKLKRIWTYRCQALSLSRDDTVRILSSISLEDFHQRLQQIERSSTDKEHALPAKKDSTQ